MTERAESFSQSTPSADDPCRAVYLHPAKPGPAQILLVCEHASNDMPAHLGTLGLTEEARRSHIAWDPGARDLAHALHGALPAALVEGGISRLVYDCNRPPDAHSAIPAKSEIFDVPGNQNLSAEERAWRQSAVYEPFTKALADVIAAQRATLELMVTVHSFTPVYHGAPRAVEIGILHGRDARFAEAMMHHRPDEAAGYNIQLNAPYGAQDGVAHTLDMHGAGNGLPNVMLEIRNDLIAHPAQQQAMGQMLARWITGSLTAFNAERAGGEA